MRSKLRQARPALLTALFAVAVAVTATASAANIVGTPRNDVLRGTARADRLDGKAGNDRLLGMAGNDVLIGGAGNDTLTGGPGGDTLRCGPGRDRALADPSDAVAADCERVSGLPVLSIADAAGTEGDSGTKTLSFAVTLSTPSRRTVSVAYATADGSALGASDYAAANGTLAFAPGETSKTVEVAVNGDIEVEADEAFTLVLSRPANATIGDGSATGTIQNEDRPRPRTGRYNGTTSQGRPISFDVAADWTYITNLSFRVDIRCQEVPIVLANELINFGAARIPLSSDFRFEARDSFSDADGSGTLVVSGALAAPGSGNGSLQFDLTVNVGSGVHCSTGNVTWNAA